MGIFQQNKVIPNCFQPRKGSASALQVKKHDICIQIEKVLFSLDTTVKMAKHHSVLQWCLSISSTRKHLVNMLLFISKSFRNIDLLNIFPISYLIESSNFIFPVHFK